MTLQQIKYVIGVAENGSLNKASEKLFISQPSLTASIHDTEEELGFQIFKRSSRGAVVTEQGERFVTDARRV
ncbi:LysR family transcriptional regulator, partial [Treponema sp.]|uniref:LysR family transcriptional regulator n=1 Tax=Treponema sp. TaxID=166 RepID=UPI00388D5EB7